MDYGQSATTPLNPKKGDTFIPLDPHPFAGTVALGERLVYTGTSWTSESQAEREAKGLHLLPEPSAALPPLGPPQLMAPEAAATMGLAEALGKTPLGVEEGQRFAKEEADWMWARGQAAEVVKIFEEHGVAAVPDVEALAQTFFNQRNPPTEEEGGPDWASLLGGGGEAPPIFSPQEERMIVDYKNAIAVGQLSQDQAWKQLENYWSEETAQARRAEEAGRRGETLLAGAFPGTTFPGTGPGGIGAALAEKWGGPNLMPALKGIPMEQALGMFGTTQAQMGLPETLGPISPPKIQLPNWGALGQAMPQFGGRNNYFDQLLQEGRSTAPEL